MIFAALDEAASKGELILVFDGLCRFHRRKDGVVVIRELIVMPFRRRTGVGRRLLEQLRRRFPGAALEAKCPASYESNGFWRACGFALAEEGEVNRWRLN